MTISDIKEWNELKEHKKIIENQHLKDMFKLDNKRFDKFSIEAVGLFLDYSKNRINDDTMSLLFRLANSYNLEQKINSMFEGKRINNTEDRAVLHIALRNRGQNPIFLDRENIMTKINVVLSQMSEFVKKVHSGEWKGFTNKPITDIVNIGIGGSDLGPAMVCEALKPYRNPNINIHFVSNVDGTHIVETLKYLKPDTTLFIISSKTFTTQETITNANSARKWLLNAVGGDENAIPKHFVAISTNSKAVYEFGIDLNNMFEFWDWVGGRFSLWSAIGLSIALYIGWENFISLLNGAYLMDNHFKNTQFNKNLPIIMALLELWYVNFFDASSYAIIPYDQYLNKFPLYLQQLEMESNGKQVTKDGNPIPIKTSPVIWGAPGTNAQHSFFQLLHQGSHLIPIDFIASLESHNDIDEHFEILLSNFFAQTEALMMGKTEEEVQSELIANGYDYSKIKSLLPHKVFSGNKPTNSILYNKLTPEILGSLIALYEHKVFVHGCLWDINSFDQWGVELGKQLAKKILPQLKLKDPVYDHDSSTNGLINYYKKYKFKTYSNND